MADPEGTEAETTIMDLPYEVKLKIFGMMEWKEKKVIKLVCPAWYHLVNNIPYSFKLSSKSISVLKNCKVTTIPKLVVVDEDDEMTEDLLDLPIYSSTRIYIPKANVLKLDSCKNSADNTIKLIRYYAKHCKSLDLLSATPFFENIEPFRMKKAIPMNNIVELKLFLLSPFAVYDSDLDLARHGKALAQFLLSVQLPSLQVLEFGMLPFFAVQDPDVEPAEVANNLLARSKRASKLSALKAISVALDMFLKKYSKQIKRLKTFMPTLETLRILTEFINLQWFELVITRIPNGRDITFPKLLTCSELSELLGKIKALKSLIVSRSRYTAPISLEFIYQLFAACSKNLENFVCLTMDTLSGPALLDWLYDFELRKLTKLELKGLSPDKIPLEKALLKRTKLLPLKELTLGLKDTGRHTGNNEPDERLVDWRRDIVKWIVQVCPNLITLKLGQQSNHCRFELDLEHIYTMIVELCQLKSIDIGLGSIGWDSKLKVTRKVELWFKKQANSSIIGQWSGRGYCKYTGGTFEIRISRPLDNLKLPEGFRSLV